MLGGRYRMVGRLGVGGMGEVYRADDLTLGQAVALKFLPESVERDPDRLEQLTAEIRTARQISHPSVCRVYDIGEVTSAESDRTARFLTMEYVDGEDLRSLLRRIGRLPEDKGLEIARQVCAGLAAIHDREILHRDLKPANIMLDGRGKVRLTDFGLATAVAGAGADGDVAGTPAYMAPEQLAGEPLSVATDLYALGLVLFEIFTGERLQTGDSVAAIREAQASAAATLTSSASGEKLDPVVQRVIARCLDVDPARRPQSAVAVAAALPGGDPLAAALAAGETPSPRMVAAAGDTSGLPFAVAVPLLVTFVACLGLAGWLEEYRAPTSQVPLPNSPDVMASKAREMLDRLGYGGEIGDRAYRFEQVPSTNAYQLWLDEQAGGPERWFDDIDVRPALWQFWYRTSPGDLQPTSSTQPVGVNNPPLSIPGMTRLRLDPDGRLTTFDAVPPTWSAANTSSEEPNWTGLFDEAGLDMDAFVETTPEWVGASPSDVRKAWLGPGATTTGAELRVEAAAFDGRPVFFRLVAPWTPRAASVAVTREARPGEAVLAFVLAAVVIVLPIVAVSIARYNLRRGRVDTRGATRVAVTIGVLASVGSILATQQLPRQLPVGVFEYFAMPALVALLAWCFYAAIEPSVRRAWPGMLISWTRLIDGRWRDPLVGRDLLVGSTLMAVARLTIAGWERFIRSLGMETGVNPLRLSFASIVDTYLGSAQGGLFLVFGLALLLVLARLTLRSERRALIGVVAVVSLPFPLLTSDLAVFGLLMFGVPIVAMTRWGLLAAWAYVFPLFTFFTYFWLPPFATAAMVTSLALVLLPGVFGFYTATRGRVSGAWLER